MPTCIYYLYLLLHFNFFIQLAGHVVCKPSVILSHLCTVPASSVLEVMLFPQASMPQSFQRRANQQPSINKR